MAAKGPVSREAARAFFEKYYTPVEVGVAGKPGLLTGYYEPEVHGSRERTGEYQIPVYMKPEDIVAVTPDGQNLLVGVGKGLQTMPNPVGGKPAGPNDEPKRKTRYPYIGTTLSGMWGFATSGPS